jgi:Protein of unknown function (DUF3386)/Domain of unknown function (DUF4198)
MKLWLAALVAFALTTTTARAHFVWLIPSPSSAGKQTVQVIFSDSLQPDDPELLKKIAPTEMFCRGSDGKSESIKKYTEGKADAYRADMPGKGPRAVGAVCRYGVIQRGQSEPYLLNYYAKTYIGHTGRDGADTTAHFHRGWDQLPLDIVPDKEKPAVQVLWQGKPLADAEVVLLVPGVEKAVERKTDRNGLVAIDAPKAAGLYGIRARHVEPKEGEHDGKKYKEVRHYATFVTRFEEQGKRFEAPSEPKQPAALQPDATATKLLADARAARAQWQNFPGFSADVEVYTDGKTSKGRIEVSARGDVSLKLDDPAAETWARRTLSSITAHRLDNSAAKNTPCAFTDDDANHPLGRAIRVLNDEFHSSYRVRDRQIIVVNRQMDDVRFTISVLENRLNEEKHFLPASYVVNTWDAKTDALKSSEAHHQTWTRVGKFDLPRTVTVVKASAGQQEARSIKLSNHQLMP